mgnify:CR=1 FL=1
MVAASNTMERIRAELRDAAAAAPARPVQRPDALDRALPFQEVRVINS